jgi:hypothetical protein
MKQFRSNFIFIKQFRTGGAGELYMYADLSKQVPALCDVKPQSICNPNYGLSIGRGSFKFETGKWNHVIQTVTLNTPEKTDGKVLITVNGVEAINFPQIYWRGAPGVGFLALDVQTFFGGSDSSWATPTEQFSYFKDFGITLG